MNKKDLSERDICSKFIGPSIKRAGWDGMMQIPEEVAFTKGRIIVRGKLVTRGKAKRADYILYYKPNIPIAIIEGKDSLVNNHGTYARDYYAEEASGTSHSMKNVSREVIYALPVPLPPAREQERIVARVRELMALCDQLEAHLTNGQVSKSNLLESVLHHALNDNQMHPFSRESVGIV